MKAFIKKLSLLFAVGAMAFGSNLLNNEAKVAKAATTATATFGTNNIRIDSASVDFKDSQNNNWNVKTSGTTSFTASSEGFINFAKHKTSTMLMATTANLPMRFMNPSLSNAFLPNIFVGLFKNSAQRSD